MKVAAGVTDDQTASVATGALRIIAIAFVFSGIPPLVSAYFQAIGRPTPSYLISIGTLLAIKVPLVVALAHLGTVGLWARIPAGEALSAAVALALLWRWRPQPVDVVRLKGVPDILVGLHCPECEADRRGMGPGCRRRPGSR